MAIDGPGAEGEKPKIEAHPADLGELVSAEPSNPWEQKLRDKGLPLDIPTRFLNPSLIPDGNNIDPLTGLPLEEDGIKDQIAQDLAKCIKEGKNWAMVYGDVDNLKTANTIYGRELGDMVIRYGSAQLTQALDPLQFYENNNLYAVRQTNAADETFIWMFDVSPEQIDEVKTKINDTAREVKEIEVEDGKTFLFSQSAVVLSSQDDIVRDAVEKTKETLDVNPDVPAFTEFRAIKQLADNKVKEIKIVKDIKRLPIEKLREAQGIDQIIEIIVYVLGDSRSSKELISKVLSIVKGVTQVEAGLAMLDTLENNNLTDGEKLRDLKDNADWLALGLHIPPDPRGLGNAIASYLETVLQEKPKLE